MFTRPYSLPAPVLAGLVGVLLLTACTTPSAPTTVAATLTTIPLTAAASTSPPAATPTTAVTGAPTPAPTQATTAQTLREFSTGDLDQGGAEQPAGKYQTPVWFDVPFQFETATDYRGGKKSWQRGQIFALERGQNSLGNATHRLVFFAFPSDVSGVETTFRLRETTLLDSSEIRDITLFNVTGAQWEAVAQPNPAQKGESGVADGAIAIPALFDLIRLHGVWHTSTPGARLQFIVAEPPGRTLLIYIEAPPDDFEAWASETEELLKTVMFVSKSEAALPATAAPQSNAPPGEIWGQPGGGLALDAQDNVYVMRADAMIYKYDPTGKLLTQWGGPGSGEGQFKIRDGAYFALNLAVDAEGNVFVVDIGNFRIQKFDANGKFLTQWGSPGKEPGQFSRGWAIAVDSKGNVYVGDEGNQRVQKFDGDGNFLTQWGKFGPKDDEFYSIYSVDVDYADNVYVGDYFQEEVKKFDSNGNLLMAWDSCGPGVPGETIRPIAFAFDDRNNVYMLDGFGLRVCIYDADGKFSRSWGTQGQGIGEFDFHEDGDIAMDSQGHLYVAEGISAGYTGSRNTRIQKFRLNK